MYNVHLLIMLQSERMAVYRERSSTVCGAPHGLGEVAMVMWGEIQAGSHTHASQRRPKKMLALKVPRKNASENVVC